MYIELKFAGQIFNYKLRTLMSVVYTSVGQTGQQAIQTHAVGCVYAQAADPGLLILALRTRRHLEGRELSGL